MTTTATTPTITTPTTANASFTIAETARVPASDMKSFHDALPEDVERRLFILLEPLTFQLHRMRQIFVDQRDDKDHLMKTLKCRMDVLTAQINQVHESVIRWQAQQSITTAA